MPGGLFTRSTLLTPRRTFMTANRERAVRLCPAFQSTCRGYLHNQFINYSEVWWIICSQISNVLQKEAEQFLRKHGLGAELSADPQNKATGSQGAVPCVWLTRVRTRLGATDGSTLQSAGQEAGPTPGGGQQKGLGRALLQDGRRHPGLQTRSAPSPVPHPSTGSTRGEEKAHSKSSSP